MDPARQLAEGAAQLVSIRVLRIHISHLNGMLRGEQPITIAEVLVLRVLRRNTEETLDSSAGPRTWDVIAAIGKLDTEDCDCYGIDRGPIARDLHASSRRNSAHGCAKALLEIRGFTVIRHRGQGCRRKALGRDAIALPCALVTTEVEEPVLLDWAANSSPELILLQHLLLRPT